jgi:1,2-phenylacetyl-CoA epoxidase PaaB subunit
MTSEVFTAVKIWIVYSLKMEAAGSSERVVTTKDGAGVITQKTTI